MGKSKAKAKQISHVVGRKVKDVSAKSLHTSKKAVATSVHVAKKVPHTKAYKKTKQVAKKTTHQAKRVVKVAHKQVAQKPHEKLMVKSTYYAWWHTWQYKRVNHKHVHHTALIAYVLVIVAIVFHSMGFVFAADISDTWNFSNPSNFTLDDAVETSGSSARLKGQNYTSDANTAGLFHMDESGGNTVTDSSSHNNDGNASNVSWGSGNINNAGSFNGTNSRVKVPDSASLSFSQKNTLEAWTKLNSSFFSGSSASRQGILDKGDYQLYYDNETGKVTYELANANANSWTPAGGRDVRNSWDTNGKRSVQTSLKLGSDIYVGLGTDIGDAEVWRWDGTSWTLIGGGPNAINSSWTANTYEGVYSLATDGTNLYAGLGSGTGEGEVWQWNGSTWTKIGGDGINGGWTNYAEFIYSMDHFGGYLYAGLGSGASEAEVWRWDGTSWTKIGDAGLNGGWGANYEYVGNITNDGTNLYVGLGSTAGDSEVWRWDGTSWTKIGGDSLNSSWGATIEMVYTLKYYNGNLYAGLGNSASDAEVWRWDGTSWTKIGDAGLNGGWGANYEYVTAMAWDGSNLYAGLGGSDGDGEVWKWDGSSWTKVGGDSVNSGWTASQGDVVNTLLYDGGKLYSGNYDASGDGFMWSLTGSNWDLIGGGYVNKSWGNYGISSVNVMQKVGDYLYAGLGNYAGTAGVWRFDGTSWEMIGGQGINNSWSAVTFEQVMSIASYQGKLIVGLGTSANDAEVWQWDGSTWTKIGGDSINSGWTINYDEVDSLAADGTHLYAGLGNAGGEGEVWQWDGSSWTKIGGDGINTSWTSYVENVYSLSLFDGKLIAGLGRSWDDAEVWQWDGSSWTKIGGDSVNNSWGTSVAAGVMSMMPYNGKLYAGLGYLTGSATLWEFDGSSWTKVGGDDVNNSWTTGTFESVKTLAVYNGDLFAGLGNSGGDGEVWRLSDGAWTKIGGTGLNNGWASEIEEIGSFSAYKGKLYVGTGLTPNADARVWSWGDNAFVQSNQSNFDTSWHHIAATYDGNNAKIFIDGTEDASSASNITLPDSGKSLLIGTTYGGREYGKPVGYFNGQIDEVRISNIDRTSFNSRPYVNTAQLITLASAIRKNGVESWDGFSAAETLNGGTISYRLSDDDGDTWKYWNGSSWVLSTNTSQSSSESDINANIPTFPVTFDGIRWQAIMKGDGYQRVTLDSVNLTANSDNNAPGANASGITAFTSNGGSSIAANAWTNSTTPYFTWTAAADSGSGIYGYCLYLGQTNTSDPVTTKGLLGTTPVDTGGQCQFLTNATSLNLADPNVLGTGLSTSNSPYYLNVKAIDKAGNLFPTSEQFQFRFDNTKPTSPAFITAPSQFVSGKEVTFTWPTIGNDAASDSDSGIVGLQYRIGANGQWYGDGVSGAGMLNNDGSYVTRNDPDFPLINDGNNVFYFRAVDGAGNVSSGFASATLKLNTGSPSGPQNVAATPSTNNANSFAFSWDAPSAFAGDEDDLTYCYTVNTLPSATTCTYTTPGVTALTAGAYATQPGDNTFYVVARDNNINYATAVSVTFTANTTAPGMPLDLEVGDVSNKATSTWRLALSWNAPSNPGAGVASYRIYRSTDNTNFAQIASTSGSSYVDGSLSQVDYYYKIRACDSANNCGAYSQAFNKLPTGRFTTPASLTSDPLISNISTKKATIRWSTDRQSDSKILIGTKSGSYEPFQIASADQVTDHIIDLTNLTPGTTYFVKATWTDEDGNTGSSDEFSFKTEPAPSTQEVVTRDIGLSTAQIQFTSVSAAKVVIQYGKSDGFGGLKEISTSLSKSTYTVELTGLDDGTKYLYRLNTYDSEGNEYVGSTVLSFATPARPRIENLQFQPVKGEPTSTQKITWSTNVPASSFVRFSSAGITPIEMSQSKLVTQHEIVIRNLLDDTMYSLVAESRDQGGNLAVSDAHSLRTALDTRPPKISDVTVETTIRGTGAEARGQIVVSWKTDEPATSQVAYAEGSQAETFNNKTAEDGTLATEHIVIVSDLPTSRVYSVQPVSKDKGNNTGTGEVKSGIIGRASDSVLTIVLTTLKKVFGF